MEKKIDVMERVKMLPENYDGIVRFTNWTEEDFTSKWNSKEYLFKANTTSPLLMIDQTPLEMLNICKKFALDLAVREWGKTKWYNDSLKRERNVDGSPRGQGMSGAASYSIDQLAPLIQKGLYIYPESRALVKEAPRVALEDKLSRNDEGHLNTKPVKKGASMRDMAKEFEE